jgi:hypothetical protein
VNKTFPKSVEWILRILLLTVTLASTMVVCDALGAMWFKVPWNYEGIAYFTSDPVPSRRILPNLNRYVVGPYREFKYRLSTDADGFRKSTVPSGAKVQPIDTIFLGDSQTVGEGMNDDETIPSIYALLTGKRVLNTGCYGCSNIEEAAILRSLPESVKPRNVVIGFFAGNDPLDNAAYAHQVRTTGRQEGSYIPKNGFTEAKNRLLERSFLYHLILGLRKYQGINNLFIWVGMVNADPPEQLRVFKTEEDDLASDCWKQTDAAIKMIHSESTRRGSRLILAFIPDRLQVDDNYWRIVAQKFRLRFEDYDRNAPNKKLKELCRIQGIAFIDLTDALRREWARGTKHNPYWKIDSHLNADGNRIIGGLLAEFVSTGRTS